jgi:hypothetical protein
METIDKCKRLVYPNYTAGGIVIPPYCYVRFGGIVKMFAIIDSVNVSWSGTIISDNEVVPSSGEVYSGNTDPNENVYSQCELSFSFTELRTKGQPLPTGNELYEVNKNADDFVNDGEGGSTDPDPQTGEYTGNSSTRRVTEPVVETTVTNPDGSVTTERTETSTSSDGSKSITKSSYTRDILGRGVRTDTTTVYDKNGNVVETITETERSIGGSDISETTKVTTRKDEIIEEVTTAGKGEEEKVITTKKLNSDGDVISTSSEYLSSEVRGNAMITTSSDGSKVEVENSVIIDGGIEKARSLVKSYNPDGSMNSSSIITKYNTSRGETLTEANYGSDGKLTSLKSTTTSIDPKTGNSTKVTSYTDGSLKGTEIVEKTQQDDNGNIYVVVQTTNPDGSVKTDTIQTEITIDMISNSGKSTNEYLDEYLDEYLPKNYRSGEAASNANAYSNSGFDNAFNMIIGKKS